MSVVRQLASDVVQPEYCRQNDGHCYAAPASPNAGGQSGNGPAQDQAVLETMRLQNVELLKRRRQEESEYYMRQVVL